MLDASGTELWRRALPGTLTNLGPAVGPNDQIYVSIHDAGSEVQRLLVFSVDGELLRTSEVGIVKGGGVESPIAVGNDGSAYVRTWEGLFAVDSAGRVRWNRWHHPNTGLGIAIDAQARVLLTPTGVLLDPETGDELWSVSFPASREGNTFYFAAPGVLGAYGVIISDHGGYFHALRD
jgi:outer membrane protein assembly factor BamB